MHRIPPKDWKIKSATITRLKDGTYQVSVLFEFEKIPVETRPVIEDRTVGLDYKSDGLYVSDTGETADMPHWYRNSARRLGRLQRKLSKKQDGSQNCEKARLKLG